jgi:microcystin-dependent protein
LCNGQLLPINQNQALFALLGTRYGGNGQTNFALPNLRGRVPIHMSSAHTLGEAAGSTSVTVNIQQLPTHNHMVTMTTAPATQPVPAGNLMGNATAEAFGSPTSLTTLGPTSVSSVGGSQPHNNMMPYLVLNFIIALQGIFPSQN